MGRGAKGSNVVLNFLATFFSITKFHKGDEQKRGRVFVIFNLGR